MQLKNESEPYLITLYGKALDSRKENSILNDTFANEVISKIDFDFTKLKTPKGAEVSLPLRARHFDGWTREFLIAHPGATILNLGCGLDSRVFRIDPPASVHWYDVDLPDVIDLRRDLYPERTGCILIGSSVTDPGWLDNIPADHPVLVVAEGLLQYLTEQDVINLFTRITGKFPGGQIIFDAYSRNMIHMVMLLSAARRSRPVLLWGIGDPRELEKHIPHLRLITDISFLTMPELVERISPSRIGRAISLVMSPFVKKMVRHLRYEF